MVDGAQQRQCGRKVIYVSLAEAARAAKRMHKKTKARYNAYQCHWCGGFHFGTNRSTDAARRREERRGVA